MFPVIINQAGPLPITVNVDWPSSGSVMVAVSGSAFTNNPNTTLAVKVTVHSTTLGTVQHYANPAGTHLAFPTAFFAVNGEIGPTTFTLTAANATTITDQNDHFTVALIY